MEKSFVGVRLALPFVDFTLSAKSGRASPAPTKGLNVNVKYSIIKKAPDWEPFLLLEFI
jgi:hypothetical protein